jgi:3-phosphoshikimate 1-carboxyvinyltransferase
MAFAGAGAENVAIKVDNLKSKPYIDLTLHVMRQFGWPVENRNYTEFYFPPHTKDNHLPSRVSYVVEGDWSGGAFLLVAGAIAGNITVYGLDAGSTQADKAILNALEDCGAIITLSDNKVEIGPSALKSFYFDANDCPDLFPPLVALAAYCNGVSTIKGINRLTHKESNRALSLKQEFGKMGVEIELQDDLMLIKGNKTPGGALVHSNHDHRIAMACAVAALHARGSTTIEDAEAVNKSYPDFFDHLKYLGASVSLTNQLINK